MKLVRPAIAPARLLASCAAVASLAIAASAAADEPSKAAPTAPKRSPQSAAAAPDRPPQADPTAPNPSQSADPLQVVDPLATNKVATAPEPPLKLIVLADPEPLPPAPWVTSSSNDTWYTGRKPYKRPSLRVAAGTSVRIGGKDPSVTAAYTMDFMLGGHFGLHPGKEQLGLIPEVGYTWRTPGREHQLSAGLGLAWGMGMSYHTIAIIPRLIVDPSHGDVALGERTGLLWCFRENGFAAEIAHQYERRGGVAYNDVRATVSIDVALLALVVGGVKKL